MSQPGSPQAAGSGPEAMLASLLLQLQQGQAEIARTTQEGLKQLADGIAQSAKRPGIVDVKGIGKADVLKGTHEEVQKIWKTWSYKFETWFSSQWGTGQAALDYARKKGDDPITAHDLLNSSIADIDAIDSHLHVALVSLTHGMAYDIVFNSRKKCGLDAWRRLCGTYEPQNNRTNIRLLRRFLNPPRATMSTLRSGIDRFEADVAEYEARGQPKPSDEILRAVLLQLVPENLEEHLELNIQRFDTYSKMRAEVISFLEQKVSKSLVDDGGAAPMELDYVGGKGKGKKGKDKGGNVKYCYNCNKAGHLARDCWQNPKGKGKSNQGGSHSKGKGDSKGKGKGSKGTKAQGKGKGQNKSGKNHAMEGDEPEGEQFAEGEEWADYQAQEGDWPATEATYEEPGEQGAICVGEGLSAVSARAKAASRAAKKLQEDFEGGKLWKRPQNFWNMPWKLVCQESYSKAAFKCGYQGCWRNHKEFSTSFSYKQHLWSKVGTEGHPTKLQLDAWELREYLVPHGQKPYPLWDQATGKIKTEIPAEGDDPVLHHMQAGGGGCVKLMDKQFAKMKKSFLEGMERRIAEEGHQDAEDEEGGEEEALESDESLSIQSDYNVYRSELVEVSDEEEARAMQKPKKKIMKPASKAKAVEESKETKALRPPLPRLRKGDKDKEKDERPPLERRVPVKGKSKGSAASARPAALSKGTLKGKGRGSVVPTRPFLVAKGSREEEDDDSEEESPAEPMSSRPSKEVKPDEVMGLTPGAVAVFSQNLILQRLEEIKQLEGTYALLLDDNPAKKPLKATIDHLKKEVEELKAEKAKSKPAGKRKYSSRQESDKKAAGGRVAYIKERQRRRAASQRAEGLKERVTKRLANEEAYEREFNQEGKGRKRQTFPLSTGEFAKDQEAMPLTKREKKFRAEEEEEMPEVKERSMKLPASEVKRKQTKRAREKEKKKRKAEEEETERSGKKRKKESKERGREEKKEKKRKKERKEERTTSRGSAASARQGDRKKSFDPSKGRMGGSSSDDGKERGSLNRLEPPVKIPWSNEGPQGENWTRVDLIVDSGASDSTLPLGVLPGHEIGEARGYKEFSMADGRILPNLGTKKLQMAFQCGRIMTGTFSVVDTSKPLLSVGKLVSMGHKVEMNPNGKGSIILKDGGRIAIYLRNGVWKIPVWIWDPFQGQDN